MPEPTFVFDDDGNAYAYLDGKIVASASDVGELEKLGYGGFPPAYPPSRDPNVAPVAGPSFSDMAADEGPHKGDSTFCPQCGTPVHTRWGECPSCGSPLGDELQPHDEPSAVGQADLPAASPDTLPGDNLPPRATHVETPNGLKGQILGRVKGLWGDQVTIRLENGRIAKFDVTSDLNFIDESTQKTASTQGPLVALQERLDEGTGQTKADLVARVAELKKIKAEASALIRTRQASADAAHEIVVLADHELHEVSDALDAMTDAEPYAPPAPFDPQVVEQESVGGNDSSWLDNTMGEMIAEAEATDFDQMMEEEPGQIVTEMETPALEDPEGVRDYAEGVVMSKTTGLDREAVADFKKVFLARVEQARVDELAERDIAETNTPHEASVDEGPDEGLFL